MIEFKNKLPRVLSCFFEDFKHLKAYLSAGIATRISTKGSTENSISAIDQFRIGNTGMTLFHLMIFYFVFFSTSGYY